MDLKKCSEGWLVRDIVNRGQWGVWLGFYQSQSLCERGVGFDRAFGRLFIKIIAEDLQSLFLNILDELDISSTMLPFAMMCFGVADCVNFTRYEKESLMLRSYRVVC